MIVATGGGRLVAVAAETFTRAITTAEGTQLVVRDVRPLGGGDEIGIGIFLGHSGYIRRQLIPPRLGVADFLG